MSREQQIGAFLATHGFGGAMREPLAQDASFRRYWRLRGGPRPAVLMDAPPPEDTAAFIRIAAHLRGTGLSAPEVLAHDVRAGLVLEEDFGDGLLSLWIDPLPAPAFDDPMVDRQVTAAIDALIVMQRAAPPAALPDWDAAAMVRTTLGTLFDWWWPAMFGGSAPDAARAEVADALTTVLAPVATGPTCLVHRDFFAGNLLWLPDRPAPRSVGIIDFQGAAIGHPAYDLASLLEDERRDLPMDIPPRATARYLEARPELDPEAFLAAYAACAVQRHLRVACQWVRLALRDHRPQYLVHGPRSWRNVEACLSDPALVPLAQALDRWIPADRRTNPPGLTA